MNKTNKNTVIIIALLLLPGISAIGAYSYFSKAPKNKRHGVGIQELSCDDSVVFSLRLKHNGKLVWTKTHEEFFNLPIAIPSTDNRFRDKNIVPLRSLLGDYEPVESIEAIPCDGEAVTIDYKEILNSNDFYYLGQNHRGRMKLLKQINEYDHLTIKRNMIDLNIVN